MEGTSPGEQFESGAGVVTRAGEEEAECMPVQLASLSESR